MATPFAVTGALNYPGDVNLPITPIPVALASAFNSEASAVLNLSGSGTHDVDLGSITSPGVKALLIKVDPSVTASPVLLSFNGSSTGRIEIAPGGFLLYGNPNPAAGVTALSLIYTTACIVRIWALG